MHYSRPYATILTLGVSPDAQGQGMGHALVADLIGRLGRRGFHRLTVNTQNDNFASLALYRKMGFRETGEWYAVFEYPVQ